MRGGETNDGINEHLRRWEATLAGRRWKRPFSISLKNDITPGSDLIDHFVILHELKGEMRLVEVKLFESPPGASEECALTDAPRAVRLEALRRLPKAFEGALIRESQS